jgi:hypothetical protein
VPAAAGKVRGLPVTRVVTVGSMITAFLPPAAAAPVPAGDHVIGVIREGALAESVGRG